MNELQTFAQLGKRLRQNDTFARHFEPLLPQVTQQNPWFIPEFVKGAYDQLAAQLQEQELSQLLDSYCFEHSTGKRKRIAVAANCERPFDNFFDLLYILLSGNDYIGKLDASDKILLPELVRLLTDICPEMGERIHFTDRLTHFDAIIIDETPNSGLLCQYVQRFPHLIRPHCHRVALLNGQETEEQLRALSQDIYLFFGRSAFAVSELCVPEGYDFVPLLQVLHEESQPIAMHNHFLNHLDYQKAIRLMNKQFYMDAGTFLLVEKDSAVPFEHSPGIVRYSFYENAEEVSARLQQRSDIQDIVCQSFDHAHIRRLNDFTAGADVLHFIEQKVQ